MSTKPLIIFDSGIGGLSILKVLLSQSISYPILYFADQAYFPYGSKSPRLLKHRLLKIFHWFAQLKPLGVVVACNTATAISLDALRHRFSFPIFGIEPVIKPLSKFQPTLLLATPVTLQSSRTKALIKRYQPRQFYYYPSKHLASYIETMSVSKIKAELLKIKDNYDLQFQAIGLSCTHYPLVKPLIVQTFSSATIIEPSLAVVKHLIKTLSLTYTSLLSQQLVWVTTGDTYFFSQQLRYYLQISAKPLKIDLESKDHLQLFS